MKVRPLDLLDLPFLQGYRQGVLPLDSARLLTRGNPLGPTALLSYLNPRRTLYSAVCTENGNSLMGQVILNKGETCARLVFLAPTRNINGLTLPLLDHLTSKAGAWGAYHILAEVDEDSPAFQALRQAGFAMYAWQRAWRLPEVHGGKRGNTWRQAGAMDWPAVLCLHAQIVPALLQPVEILPRQVSGVVCFHESGLQAYASFNNGLKGTWLKPLVLPDSPCVTHQLGDLVETIEPRNRREIYICVRSYQAWLESSLEELGAEAGPRLAVMVKHLTKTVRQLQPANNMEKALAKVKPAAPVKRIRSDR